MRLYPIKNTFLVRIAVRCPYVYMRGTILLAATLTKLAKRVLFLIYFLLLIFSSSTRSLYALYLWNRLELDAHILTKSRCWGLDVPFGGLFNCGLEGSIFGAKNYVFGNKSCTLCISGSAWSWTLILLHKVDAGV